eukprot:scaffold14470_cov107-Isochrysis_galbana.AAC.4
MLGGIETKGRRSTYLRGSRLACPRCRACAHAFAWLLVSGAREYPQAPLDVAERETPERGGKGVRCACGGGACTHRLVGCWDIARPLGEGQIVVLHRGLDVGERRCLPTVARRVRNPHRTQEFLPEIIISRAPGEKDSRPWCVGATNYELPLLPHARERETLDLRQALLRLTQHLPGVGDAGGRRRLGREGLSCAQARDSRPPQDLTSSCANRRRPPYPGRRPHPLCRGLVDTRVLGRRGGHPRPPFKDGHLRDGPRPAPLARGRILIHRASANAVHPHVIPVVLADGRGPQPKLVPRELEAVVRVAEPEGGVRRPPPFPGLLRQPVVGLLLPVQVVLLIWSGEQHPLRRIPAEEAAELSLGIVQVLNHLHQQDQLVAQADAAQRATPELNPRERIRGRRTIELACTSARAVRCAGRPICGGPAGGCRLAEGLLDSPLGEAQHRTARRGIDSRHSDERASRRAGAEQGTDQLALAAADVGH